MIINNSLTASFIIYVLHALTFLGLPSTGLKGCPSVFAGGYFSFLRALMFADVSELMISSKQAAPHSYTDILCP